MSEAPESFATTDGKNEPVKQGDGSSHSRADATIHDRTGLYIAIIALLVAGMAFGYEVAQRDNRVESRELQAQATDARIEAAVANARAEMQQQVAQANAIANEARVNARVAVDEIERMRTKLAAKNIVIPKEDH